MFFSMFQAFDFATSWDTVNEFFKIFLFYIMIVTLCDNQKDGEILLMFFCLATAMFAYETIFNYMHGDIVHSLDTAERLNYAKADNGMGAGHVALANLCVQALPVIWYIGVCHKNVIMKVCGCLLFYIVLSGVIFSGSRGGFLGIGALAVCLVIFSDQKLKMGLVLMALVLVIAILKPGYLNFMESFKIIGSTDVSTTSRFDGLRNGFEMLLRRPLLGVGPGCYPIARLAWFGWGLWAHNLYGEIMGDLGIMGVISFYKFVTYYMKKAFELKKHWRADISSRNLFNAIIVATIVRLFLGMGTHSLYIFFWYMLAGVVVVSSRSQYVSEAASRGNL
jgi:O-antigen ligase